MYRFDTNDIKPILGNRSSYRHSAMYNLFFSLSRVANTHLNLITGLRLERWNVQHPNNHVGHHKLSGPFFCLFFCFVATQLLRSFEYQFFFNMLPPHNFSAPTGTGGVQ